MVALLPDAAKKLAVFLYLNPRAIAAQRQTIRLDQLGAGGLEVVGWVAHSSGSTKTITIL